MNEIISSGNFLSGIISGLVASVIFLLVLSHFRPHLKISPYIAQEHDEHGTFYTFKIINLSKRPCINIRVDASIAETVEVRGGITHWTRAICLNQTDVFEISRFDKHDKNADYAWRFTTDDDLRKRWRGYPDFVRFRVIATDPVSGFSRAYLHEYTYKILSLKKGTHEFGCSLQVITHPKNV